MQLRKCGVPQRSYTALKATFPSSHGGVYNHLHPVCVVWNTSTNCKKEES